MLSMIQAESYHSLRVAPQNLPDIVAIFTFQMTPAP